MPGRRAQLDSDCLGVPIFRSELVTCEKSNFGDLVMTF